MSVFVLVCVLSATVSSPNCNTPGCQLAGNGVLQPANKLGQRLKILLNLKSLGPSKNLYEREHIKILINQLIILQCVSLSIALVPVECVLKL